MESKIVIGIIDIVEDLLREHNVILPDEYRENSEDPIVGYAYAVLHDRIQEFLHEMGMKDVLEKQPYFIYKTNLENKCEKRGNGVYEKEIWENISCQKEIKEK